MLLWEGVVMCPGRQVVPMLPWAKEKADEGGCDQGSCRLLGTTIHLL